MQSWAGMNVVELENEYCGNAPKSLRAGILPGAGDGILAGVGIMQIWAAMNVLELENEFCGNAPKSLRAGILSGVGDGILSGAGIRQSHSWNESAGAGK